ncbi:hypothetical protein An14g05280 [Aspergillus niger]|uniref:Uncharacterized protein n=2 Tax=Aspergillus niger TaxID=5061 RepID=A2R3S1_ASPNC|nr:hypothetical protein An14g05280 [Aspergillus niger]CAK42089.1 hypothetical protein An14g05280 [Aspergillus niger]
MHQRTRSPLESLNLSLSRLSRDKKMHAFHFHLSQEAKRQRLQDKILATHAGIEEYSAGYLKPWQLLKLKIDASEVNISSKDIIKFRPCFFSPLPTDTIRTCLSKQPNKKSPDENSLGYAGRAMPCPSTVALMHYPLILDLFREKYATSVRKGFCLDSLTTLRECGATSKGKWKQQPGLELAEKLSTERWQILRILEDLEHEVPHAVCDIRQNIQVDRKKGLTVAEVKAIMRVMAVRIGLDCYRPHFLMPTLMDLNITLSSSSFATTAASQSERPPISRRIHRQDRARELAPLTPHGGKEGHHFQRSRRI